LCSGMLLFGWFQVSDSGSVILAIVLVVIYFKLDEVSKKLDSVEALLSQIVGRLSKEDSEKGK